ncbi:MAG: hypothetical protein ACFFA6_07060 [Promethearchaeota archaeon]
MQIFEVVELTEYPYMGIAEIIDGTIVGDLINDNNSDKVYLLIDHDLKRIWTYNGAHSPFKVQIYGGILAGLLRQQLKLFYRLYTLNLYSDDSEEFKKILEKPISGGRAKPIEKSAFVKSGETQSAFMVIANPKLSSAMEYIDQIPQPKHLIRRFVIVGGAIYTEIEITEGLITEEKIIIQLEKLGRLNNGFTFFKDHNYSTRLIIKERKIQGIELYIDKEDKEDRAPSLELKVPVINEDKFSRPGDINDVLKAFQIPKKLPQEKEKEKESNDSVNKS